MHYPEAWGYVRFDDGANATSANDVTATRDPYFPAKLTAMNVYYAQQKYIRANGAPASVLSDLSTWMDTSLISQGNTTYFEVEFTVPRVDDIPESYLATVKAADAASNATAVSVREDRLLEEL